MPSTPSGATTWIDAVSARGSSARGSSGRSFFWALDGDRLNLTGNRIGQLAWRQLEERFDPRLGSAIGERDRLE